jgi:hypothetical protein
LEKVVGKKRLRHDEELKVDADAEDERISSEEEGEVEADQPETKEEAPGTPSKRRKLSQFAPN